MRIEIAQKNLLSSELSLERISNADSGLLSANVEAAGWSADSPSTFVIDENFYYTATAFSLKISNPTETNIIIRGTELSVPYPHIAEELIFHSLLFCVKYANKKQLCLHPKLIITNQNIILTTLYFTSHS